MTDARTEQQNCRTLAELEALGRRRGYLNPKFWAKQIWQARQKREKNIRLVTYEGKRV